MSQFDGPVGRAALTSAVSFGLGQIGDAIVQNVATQGVNIALGQQDRFSFAAVAATALSAGIADNILDRVSDASVRASGFSDPLRLLGNATKNFVSGVITQRVRGLFEGGGRINYATIAADSFGNALGNAVVGEIGPVTAQNPDRQQNAPVQLAAADTGRDPTILSDADPLPGQFGPDDVTRLDPVIVTAQRRSFFQRILDGISDFTTRALRGLGTAARSTVGDARDDVRASANVVSAVLRNLPRTIRRVSSEITGTERDVSAFVHRKIGVDPYFDLIF